MVIDNNIFWYFWSLTYIYIRWIEFKYDACEICLLKLSALYTAIKVNTNTLL